MATLTDKLAKKIVAETKKAYNLNDVAYTLTPYHYNDVVKGMKKLTFSVNGQPRYNLYIRVGRWSERPADVATWGTEDWERPQTLRHTLTDPVDRQGVETKIALADDPSAIWFLENMIEMACPVRILSTTEGSDPERAQVLLCMPGKAGASNGKAVRTLDANRFAAYANRHSMAEVIAKAKELVAPYEEQASHAILSTDRMFALTDNNDYWHFTKPFVKFVKKSGPMQDWILSQIARDGFIKRVPGGWAFRPLDRQGRDRRWMGMSARRQLVDD